PPTISSILPSQGEVGQSLAVTITGSNTSFVQGTTQVAFGAGVTVNSVAVNSATSLVAQISIASDAAAGERTVTVTTGAQVLTAPQRFVVTTSTPGGV